MTKPTKTAYELTVEILNATGADRENTTVNIVRKNDGDWRIDLLGTPLTDQAKELATKKFQELRREYDLAPKE